MNGKKINNYFLTVHNIIQMIYNFTSCGEVSFLGETIEPIADLTDVWLALDLTKDLLILFGVSAKATSSLVPSAVNSGSSCST